jgi:O-acetylhomoserine/O-acetylserine sulfhydrylase-like pyridoxal-dependent enzyme
MRFETRAVHAGREIDPTTRAVTPSLVLPLSSGRQTGAFLEATSTPETATRIGKL